LEEAGRRRPKRAPYLAFLEEVDRWTAEPAVEHGRGFGLMAVATRPRRTARRRPEAALKIAGDESLWYKDAIIYELHVRAFYDSEGDGSGDFRGLTQKLDYLADLGVTAIWLLPFYPSPLRDDG
jgi:hypothetical protein